MRTPRTEPLYRAAVIARWCDVSCSMLQTFFLINHYTSVVPHVRTCFLNVHTSQIERYIGRVLLSATLGTDLVVFPHGGHAPGFSCRGGLDPWKHQRRASAEPLLQPRQTLATPPGGRKDPGGGCQSGVSMYVWGVSAWRPIRKDGG